jgi:hypothetical protein
MRPRLVSRMLSVLAVYLKEKYGRTLKQIVLIAVIICMILMAI